MNECVHPLRILLVEDHVVVRAGLRLLVESQAGITVVGEAGARGDALALAAREQPDLILLDLALGDEDGLDLLPDLLEAAKSARVLVLTAIDDIEAHIRALRAGAVGLVLKGSPPEVLLKAIRKVCDGEAWFDRRLMGHALASLARPAEPPREDPDVERLRQLTRRELEVVGLVCEGLRNRAVGDRLFISETTVRHHLTSIYEKLGVADRFELIVFAYRNGLVSASR